MNKNVKSFIGWAVYLAFLGAFIWGLPKTMSYFLKTQYPMAAITSGSMWPILKQGDLVMIQGVENESQIKVGDIIVFKNDIGFTIHRVISLTDGIVTTQGDANNVSDAPITSDKVIGKALTFNGNPVRIPYLGDISIIINKGKISS